MLALSSWRAVVTATFLPSGFDSFAVFFLWLFKLCSNWLVDLIELYLENEMFQTFYK